MSGRWGERPLGRGDGGYCNRKSVRAFWPFRCAREQQDDTQEQTSHNRCRTPENPPNFRLPAQFRFQSTRRLWIARFILASTCRLQGSASF